jgi:hypothetical protein
MLISVQLVDVIKKDMSEKMNRDAPAKNQETIKYNEISKAYFNELFSLLEKKGK